MCAGTRQAEHGHGVTYTPYVKGAGIATTVKAVVAAAAAAVVTVVADGSGDAAAAAALVVVGGGGVGAVSYTHLTLPTIYSV